MCGIAGFVGAGDADVLAAMCDAIVHRGPDGEGAHIDAARGVFLGQRRLIVLDPEGGMQPMWNEDGTLCVIFVGEIYNHHVLRTELDAAGHMFQSNHSDTEVLVHGFEEWGTKLLDRLNGMFTFVVYDALAGRLLLARDRFGEKPLFYAERSDAFVFGSELHALLKHPAITGVGADAAALRKFFAYGFFPSPHTPYDRVRKLPPGHYLDVDVATRRVRLQEYWRFALQPDDPPPGGPDEWAEELELLLGRSVADRLESDVPLGLFLSGGVDSSAILSFAADARPPESIDTFAIGFAEASFDESAHASRMAKHVGSHHRGEPCDLESARALLPDLLSRVDEPMGDPSILPTYLLCRFARQHVTVALSGDGGDELFAGYDPFTVLAKANLYHQVMPRPVHQAIAMLAGKLPPSDHNMSFDFRVKRGLRGLSFPPKLWNPVWLGALPPADIAELFNEPVDVEDLYSEAIAVWDASACTGLVDRTMEFYTRLYMADDILVKTDRAAMLNSLELRAPFLDYDLVDFVRRLPANVKYRNGHTKWLLKRMLARRLPADILDRPKKGFGIPLARWLRELPPPDGAAPVPYLDDGWLRTRWEEHRARRGDHRAALWCWMALHHGLARGQAAPGSVPADTAA